MVCNAGLYRFPRRALHEAFNLEPSALLLVENPRAAAPNIDRKIATLGGRAFGAVNGGLFSYSLEGHGQIGRSGGRDHRAWAGAAEVGVALNQLKSQPAFRLGYSLASGEACDAPGGACGSGDSTEFHNLFPLNHAYYGLMDLFGWRNMRDLEFVASLSPAKMLELQASYHFFQLQEATGRWSNAGGFNVGRGWDPTNDDNTLGHEIDLVLTYSPIKQFMLQPGYGIFLPAGGGKLLGGNDPQHFLYLWLVANFG